MRPYAQSSINGEGEGAEAVVYEGIGSFPTLRSIASKISLRSKASTLFRRREGNDGETESTREGTVKVRSSVNSNDTIQEEGLWKNIKVEVTTVTTSEPAEGGQGSGVPREKEDGDTHHVPDATVADIQNNDNDNISTVQTPSPSTFTRKEKTWPVLLDELLTETTLAQANSFARKSSTATSVRSPSSVHSSSVSRAFSKARGPTSLRLVSSPANLANGSGSPSIFGTPTHRPPNSSEIYGDRRHRSLTQQKLKSRINPGEESTLNRSKSISDLKEESEEPTQTLTRASSSGNLQGESSQTNSTANLDNPFDHTQPITQLPGTRKRLRLRKREQPEEVRGLFYFLSFERNWIEHTVEQQLREHQQDHEEEVCEGHTNCVECYHKRYIILESEIMSTSMPPEERQKIINNNRSLREVKNVSCPALNKSPLTFQNLESLLENGVISEDAYEAIANRLPAETSLASRRNPRVASPTAPSPTSVTNGFANFNVHSYSPGPPAYSGPSPAPVAPAPVAPAPSPTPAALQPGIPPCQPVSTVLPREIGRAKALYPYNEPGDCTFEVGEEISIIQYMNDEWWLGRNMKTGAEGVFPRNYVSLQQANDHNEKNRHLWNQPPSSPAPQVPAQNPYNTSVPPMAIASGSQPPADQQGQQQGHGKAGEMGKKFGKKLGNAAIFGAGATMGADLVNSIF